jgi:hypothetical protein
MIGPHRELKVVHHHSATLACVPLLDRDMVDGELVNVKPALTAVYVLQLGVDGPQGIAELPNMLLLSMS